MSTKQRWYYSMMQPSDRRHLLELLEHSGEARRMVNNISLEAFMRDRTLQLAITHLVMLVGESASRLSPEFVAGHPHVPWHESRGVRNRIVHDSFGVDYALIYEIATRDLKPLEAAVRHLVEASSHDD